MIITSGTELFTGKLYNNEKMILWRNSHAHSRQTLISTYPHHLIARRKAPATIQKYIHYIKQFSKWLGDRPFSLENYALWASELTMSPRTVNCAISAVNGFAAWSGHPEIRLAFNKVETPYYRAESRELNRTEYDRLLDTAKAASKERLHLLIMTIAGLGIRVSELRFITIEALKSGEAEITNKGRTRRVVVPKKLKKLLLSYTRRHHIKTGPVFITKNKRALSRGQIWAELKKLAELAGVQLSKVFPHNLRHLFAVQHYKAHKDIFRLSCILGHASVVTTQVYLAESSGVFEVEMEKVGLVR